MDYNFFTHFFLTALFIKIIITAVLDRRYIYHLEKHRNHVPLKFKDQITLEEHQKACDYHIEKSRSHEFFKIFDVAFLLILTLHGGLEFIHRLALTISSHWSITGVIFFGLITLMSFLVHFPKSLYFTFFIEEKYGFNKMTIKSMLIDLLKATFLLVLLGGPILWILLFIMEKLGTYWWLYAFAFLSIIQFFMMILYPKFIAPIFNKFVPLEDHETKEKIQKLLDQCQFKSSGIFVMDASKRSGHSNAYFTGIGKSKRVVFFDTLLSSLDRDEMIAILAHELGHMKKGHIKKNMILGLFFSFLSFVILGHFKDHTQFLLGHGLQTVANHTSLALFFIISDIYTFSFTPLFSLFSRKHEFEADAFASAHASKEKLISSLLKLYKENSSPVTTDPWYATFYFSHPPAHERIARLEGLH